MSSLRPSDAKASVSLRSYIISKIVPYVTALIGITGLTVLFVAFGVSRLCDGADGLQTERVYFILGGGVCGVLVGLTVGVTVWLLMRMRNAAADPILCLLHEALERMRLGDVKPFRTDYAITELRRLAEIFDRLFRLQDERVAELQELVHSVNHSLGGPLFRLLAAAEALKSGTYDPAPLAKTIREAEAAIDRIVTMALMIADNYSRINGSPPRPTDLIAVVTEAVERHRATAAEKRIALSLSLPERPLVRMAHESKISEVTANLVSNAIRYTPDGGRVSISLINEAPVQIVVSDTGFGIPKEDAERIFEAGFRSEAARSVHGTGFGLALVRSIARSYGGDCTFIPNPTGGTTFTATMNLEMESK